MPRALWLARASEALTGRDSTSLPGGRDHRDGHALHPGRRTFGPLLGDAASVAVGLERVLPVGDRQRAIGHVEREPLSGRRVGNLTRRAPAQHAALVVAAEARADLRARRAADPLATGVLRAPLPHPRQVGDEGVDLHRVGGDRRRGLGVTHAEGSFSRASKNVKMRRHASSAASASYATNNGSLSEVAPECLNRNPCRASGYSLTSCSAPSFSRADSSRAAAPLSGRSLAPYDATTGQAPSSCRTGSFGRKP